MNFNNNYNICKQLILDNDKKLVTRQRKLNTTIIFNDLVSGAITNTGISTHINLQNKFSHVAMIKARKRVQDDLFYNINTKLHKYDSKNHIYAIAPRRGAKVPVPYGFKKIGYKTRTCDKVIRRPAKTSSNVICINRITNRYYC